MDGIKHGNTASRYNEIRKIIKNLTFPRISKSYFSICILYWDQKRLIKERERERALIISSHSSILSEKNPPVRQPEET